MHVAPISSLLVLLLAWPVLAQDRVKPLTVVGELKATDPRDRIRKPCHCKVHEVELKQGEVYLIELRSVDFDAFLRLEDAQGQQLVENDDIAAADSNARVAYQPRPAGKHRAVVTSFVSGQVGEYVLRVQALTPTGPSEPLIGKLTKQSAAVKGRYTQTHRVKLEANRWYVIDVESADIDPLLILRDEKGKELSQDDDGGEGLNSRLVWHSGKGGDHLLQVISLNPGEPGLYAIRRRPYQLEGQWQLTPREKLARQAWALTHQELALDEVGRYGASLERGQQALRLRQQLYPETTHPNGHPDLAMSLNNVGSSLIQQGQYDQAYDYCTRALRMNQQFYPLRTHPKGHPTTAACLANVAEALRHRGLTQRALDCHTQALKMRQRLYPDADPDVAASLHQLATVLHVSGQNEQALDYSSQALKMRRQLYPLKEYPVGHPDLAATLRNLGIFQKEQGEYEQAGQHLTEALKMCEQLYPPARHADGHPQLAFCRVSLTALFLATGQHKQAREHAQEALRLEHRLLNRLAAFTLEADALAYANSFPLTLSAFLSTSRPGEDALAHEVAWGARAPISRMLSQRQQVLRAMRGASPEVQQQHERLVEVRRELDGALAAPTKDPAARDRRLSELNATIEQLQRALSAKLPTLKRLQELDALTPADLAARLPAGGVFIDFYHYTRFEQDLRVPGSRGWRRAEHYLAFVLNQAGKSVRVELGPAKAINDAIMVWRDALLKPGLAPERERAAAQDVARLVWQPLRPHLPAGVKTIYLAPDDALHLIPWAGLPSGHKGAILLEEAAVAVVPNGPFLLERLLHPLPDAAEARQLLAVGGVHYQLKGQGKTYLPGTARELDLLRGLAGKQRDLLTLEQGKATVVAVREALPRAHFAHIATHGHFKEKELEAESDRIKRHWQLVHLGRERGSAVVGVASRNPLGFVGLMLAGAEDGEKAGPEHGRLSGEAIFDLGLERLRLCVLSACRTGEGRIETRGEGVAGLVRAFHLAGCQDVVASLWPVDDDATAALMGLFYRKLWVEKLPPVEALRQAQLALYRHPEAIPKLAKLRGPDFTETDLPKNVLVGPVTTTASPRLWAAFTISGVGR